MNKNSIIQSGICLLLMGLATVEIAQARFARLDAMAHLVAKNVNAHRVLGLALATVGGVKIAEAASPSERDLQKQKEQPKGIRSIIIKHHLNVDAQGLVDNFRSSINFRCDYQSYGPATFRKSAVRYGYWDWIFNKLVPVKLLLNRSGTYRFGVKARSGTAEVQFDATGVKQQLRLSPTVLRESPLFEGKPCLHFCLVNDKKPHDPIVFTHDVGGIVSRDGNTVKVSAEVIQENHDGSIEKFLYNMKLFTRKGCEQNYQKDFIAKTARGQSVESQEAYIKKCLKTPIVLDVPENADVDVL